MDAHAHILGMLTIALSSALMVALANIWLGMDWHYACAVWGMSVVVCSLFFSPVGREY